MSCSTVSVRLSAHGLHQLMSFINEQKDKLTLYHQHQNQQQQEKHLNESQNVHFVIVDQIEMKSRHFIY